MSEPTMQSHTPGQMLSLAGLAAQLMLENGAETYRAEDTVRRLCRSYGFDAADVLALTTGVVISVSTGDSSDAVLRRVRRRVMDLSRVNAINELSRQAAAGEIPMAEAHRRLKAIEAEKPRSALLAALLAGLAAGSFTLMFGGSPTGCCVALLCGIVAQLVIRAFDRVDLSVILTSLIGGLVCSAIALGASLALPFGANDVETTLAGAIMPLISGLMMTNAMRDTLRGDLISGMARGLEALMVAVMVALGISLLLGLYLPRDSDMVIRSMPWYLGAAYAGLATLCFCPLLHLPRRAIAPTSLLGAAAYGGYLLLASTLDVGEVLSLFIASAGIAVLCDLLARRMRIISTVFLCGALVPLVPGLGLYRTMRDLLLGAYGDAFQVGLQTLFAVGAIALGAALGSLRVHRPEREPPFRKRGRKKDG